MRTRKHIDIDEIIAELTADLHDPEAPETERYWTKVALDRLYAERAEAIAELRASPDWNKLPF